MARVRTVAVLQADFLVKLETRLNTAIRAALDEFFL